MDACEAAAGVLGLRGREVLSAVVHVVDDVGRDEVVRAGSHEGERGGDDDGQGSGVVHVGGWCWLESRGSVGS